MKRPSFLRRPSPAMAVALLALFVALGGSALAAIGSAGIADNSVRSVDVRNNDLRSNDVRNGALGLADLSAAARTGLAGKLYHREINDGSITTIPFNGAVTLISLPNLPAGAYLVSGSAEVVSDSDAKQLRCTVSSAEGGQQGRRAYIDSKDVPYHLSDTNVIVLSKPTTVSFSCGMLGPGGEVYASRLIALRVGSAQAL